MLFFGTVTGAIIGVIGLAGSKIQDTMIDEESKQHAKERGDSYYFDHDVKKRDINTNHRIYEKVLNNGDHCYCDMDDNDRILFNMSKQGRGERHAAAKQMIVDNGMSVYTKDIDNHTFDTIVGQRYYDVITDEEYVTRRIYNVSFLMKTKDGTIAKCISNPNVLHYEDAINWCKRWNTLKQDNDYLNDLSGDVWSDSITENVWRNKYKNI